MTKTELRPVVTYERVSSEDQRERETIKTQTEALARRLTSDVEVELVNRYPDEGVSGTVPLKDRPAGGRNRSAVHGHRLLGRDRHGRLDVVLGSGDMAAGRVPVLCVGISRGRGGNRLHPRPQLAAG